MATEFRIGGDRFLIFFTLSWFLVKSSFAKAGTSARMQICNLHCCLMEGWRVLIKLRLRFSFFCVKILMCSLFPGANLQIILYITVSGAIGKQCRPESDAAKRGV